MQTIVIIGAGFSGTMVAVHLLGSPGPRRVVLIERGGRFGRGVAYGTACGAHLLNVPAGRMSALESDPDHFLRWAQERDAAAKGGSFLPRMLYGEYLAWTLDDAERSAAAASLERVTGKAIGVAEGSECAEVMLDGGRRMAADSVVLALGNFAPADPPTANPAFYSSPRYIRDPWAGGADRLSVIGPDEPVMLIGTGLTMVDIALELAGRGHRGVMHAVSRRGLLPQPHRSPAVPHHPAAPRDLDSWEPTALGMLRGLRREVEQARGRGVDWREVVTSIRHDTPRLWGKLPIAERRRFMLRLRAFWETHRHRAAPQAAAAVADMQKSGRLRIVAARPVSFRDDGGAVRATLLPRGCDREAVLTVGRVINCTGPDTNLTTLADPLIASLRERGAIVADDLGLGARTAPGGALLDARGVASKRVFLCGPLRKAELWENTAVPELRVETRALAQRLLQEVRSSGQGPLIATVSQPGFSPGPRSAAQGRF